MTAADWEQLQALYVQALECEGEARAALLQRECTGRDWLRDEVTSLLARHERAKGFLSGSALEYEAQQMAGAVRVLTPGQRLGQYEIVACLGTGAMGDVYQARDTRLDRIVALKILAGGVDNPEQWRWLEREARTASALNHPNIVTVHEIGRAD
ncbi:MAG: hypothetical protein U0Y68_09325, partial [Blastocatellia bacterium]